MMHLYARECQMFILDLSIILQTSLTASLTVIQISIISLTQEIVRVQAELSLLTGVTINLSSLEILTISITTGSISLTSATVTITAPSSQADKVSTPSWPLHFILTYYS